MAGVEGKNCPNCGVDIGVWPVFSAGLPNRIWCPRCKSQLRYRKSLLIAARMLPLLIAVAFAEFVLITQLTIR